MTKPVLIIFLLLILTGRSLFAQLYFLEKKLNTDSLLHELSKSKGQERVRILCHLAYEKRIAEAEKGLELAEEAYRLSGDFDDPELGLLATYTIGLAYHHTGDYPKAIHYSFDAREKAIQLNDTNALYQIAHCIVLSYLYSNNPDLAIQYTQATVDALKSWTHPAQQFEKSIRIGWIKMMAGYYIDAIPHFLDAARYGGATPMVSDMRIALNHSHIIKCYLKTGEYQKALNFINISEKFCIERHVDFSDFGLEYKGEYYAIVKNYDSAMICFKEMVDKAGKKGNLLDQAVNLFRIGEMEMITGHYAIAGRAFQETIEKAALIRKNKSYFLDPNKASETWYTPEQIVPHHIERNALILLRDAYSNLYEIYKSRLPDANKALRQLEDYIEVDDRLQQLDKQRDVIEVNTRYETERKEQQILLLTSENELNALRLKQTNYYLFALAGFILLAILLVLLLVRHNRMKAAQDKSILEQKLLRAQMNPHFLFNTLTSIQGYMIDNDIRKASEFLTMFAKLIRNILDNTATEWVPVAKEVNTLENYLELQKSRYQDKFDFRIEVDHLIDQEELLIPPMLAQPVIENSIEHGFRQMERIGHLEIRLSLLQNIPITLLKLHQKGYLVSLEIVDNGIGRNKSEENRKNVMEGHSPMATSIIRERMKVLGRNLNRKLRKKIGLQISDLYDELGQSRGTAVRIVLPAIYG